MKEEQKNTIDDLFAHFEGQWDTAEPELGHHHRFMDKLEGKKKRRFGLPAASIAAAIAMIFGLLLIFNHSDSQAAGLNKMSPQNREAQQYFAMMIKKEMAQVQKESTPETKQLVHDALQRMDTLEKDYNKLTQELQQKGESKKIIHAMITNLQTRVSFLEEVMQKIENIKKIKDNYHEKTT